MTQEDIKAIECAVQALLLFRQLIEYAHGNMQHRDEVESELKQLDYILDRAERITEWLEEIANAGPTPF